MSNLPLERYKLSELYDLSGKIVIITGGAGLLGCKHAEAVLEVGGIPVLMDINESVKQKAENYIRCYSEVTDITNSDDVNNSFDSILKRFGRIDVLINNASNNPPVHKSMRLENMSLENWTSDISVGLTGTFLCSKIFGGYMAENGGGVILNIASDLAVISPNQNLYRKDNIDECDQPVKPITYSVIKTGLLGMTRYLATYWADHNVRVNAISPGGVYNHQPDEFVNNLTKLIPFGRMADANEYKGAVVFLCSDASHYMTGQNLIIDGGRCCW